MTDALTASFLARNARDAVFGLAVADRRVIAVGGTTRPFVVVSSDVRGWAERPTPTNRGLRRVIPGPGNSFFVVGEYGTFARTDDDGLTWTVLDTGTSGCLHGLGRAVDGHVWICGDNGYVAWLAPDATATQRVDIGTTARQGCVLPIDDTVYLLGADGFLRASRAGTVEEIQTGATAPLTDMTRTPTGALLLSGDNGFLARAAHGERAFTRVIGATVDLESVVCLPDGRIVANGDRGVVLVSTDDGVSFTSVDSTVTDHLWRAVPFGTGVLVGTSDAGILRLAEPGDDTWADRPALPDAPELITLDPLFAAGPDGFLGEPLRGYLRAIGGDHEDADITAERDAFERTYGSPMPAEYVDFRAATAGCDPWSSFNELRLDAQPAHTIDTDGNLFEALLLRNQDNFLGTDLAEVFTGVFGFGSLGDGDTYHLEVYPEDNPPAHVVFHFNHDEAIFSGIVADSLASQVYLAALTHAHHEKLVSREAYGHGLRALRDRVDPPWQFGTSVGENFGPLDSVESAEGRDAEYFFARSQWLVYLLRNDHFIEVEDIPRFFLPQVNPVLGPVPERLDRIAGYTPTALYYLWRAFMFDEPELDDYFTAARTSPARLTRDAGAFIEELRDGRRTTVGTITDVADWLRRFRALDLDPRRADARAAEAADAAQESARRRAQADAELAPLGPDELAEAAWASLRDPVRQDAVLAAGSRHADLAGQLDDLAALPGGTTKASGAAQKVAARLHPVWQAVLVGALIRGDNPVYTTAKGAERHVTGPAPAVLLAMARSGRLDPRAAAGLRTMLAVADREVWRPTAVIGILGAVPDRDSVAAIVEVIERNPIENQLDSMTKDDLLIAAATALGAIGDPSAVPVLLGLVRADRALYDAIHPAAVAALAACVANADTPPDVPHDVFNRIIAMIDKAADRHVVAWCLLGVGRLTADAPDATRDRLRARLTDANRVRRASDPVVGLARVAALTLIGGDRAEIAEPLYRVLTGRAHDHPATVRGLRFGLRVAALFPDQVLARALPWLTRFAEPDIQRAAHDLLAAHPAQPAFDAATASDGQLLDVLTEGDTIDLAEVVREATRRDLLAARPHLAALVETVITRAPAAGTLDGPDDELLNLCVRTLRGWPLDEDAITAFDAILRHPNSQVPRSLLTDPPADERLIAAMFAVADRGRGRQADMARQWLRQFAGTPAYEAARIGHNS